MTNWQRPRGGPGKGTGHLALVRGDADHADAVATAVGFGRTLRTAGVPVTADRLQRFVESLSALDPTRRDDVYWAGRLTLCGSPEDLPRYDRAFVSYFSGEAPHRRITPRLERPRPQLRSVQAPLEPPAGDAEQDEQMRLTASASRTETLRQKDLAALTPEERQLIQRLLAVFTLPGELRRTRRYERWHRGRIDRDRTVREVLHGMGDPGVLRYQRHRRRPRRVVLLIDVSGSMSAYSDALLRFAHVASKRRGTLPTEVFTIGTRLTRITRELGHPDPDSAMAAVAGVVPDWSGGTRLGDEIKEFLDRWGQRGAARGAVAVVMSDGWERGDIAVLEMQMARLSRLAHRVVWANPRKAAPGYEPLAAGMAAALPHVDDFVEGHSLAALERLARVVQGAD